MEIDGGPAPLVVAKIESIVQQSSPSAQNDTRRIDH